MNYIKKQGQAHEDAAVKTIGGDAFNLNGDAAKGMVGNQFPTFDVSSSSEITSVKSHITNPGKCEPSDIEAYKADFSRMLGWDRSYERGMSPMEQDAERITDLSSKGFAVPTEIKNASNEETQEYLKTKTVMRIPDDHVQPVRTALEKDINNLPGNYYLPDNPSQEQIDSVLNRVQGTGLTSIQTVEAMQQAEGAVVDQTAIDSQDQVQASTGEPDAAQSLDQGAYLSQDDALAEDFAPKQTAVDNVEGANDLQQADEFAEDQAGIKSAAPESSEQGQDVNAEENPANDIAQSESSESSEGEDYSYGYGL